MMTDHSVVYPNTHNAKYVYEEACALHKKAKKALAKQVNVVHIFPSSDYDHDMEGYGTLCGEYIDDYNLGVPDCLEWMPEQYPTCPECLKEMARLNKRMISLYDQKDIYKKLQAIDKKLAKRVSPRRNHWERTRDAMEKKLLAMRKEFPPEGAEEYMTTP